MCLSPVKSPMWPNGKTRKDLEMSNCKVRDKKEKTKMNYNTIITVALTVGAMAFGVYASDDKAGGGKDTGKNVDCLVGSTSPKARKMDEKGRERRHKTAAEWSAEVCENSGWELYEKDKAEAVKWWCRAGSRASEMAKSLLRLMYNGEERELVYNTAGAMTASGGCPVPDSTEPLAFRVECGRKAYIDKWLGFSEPTWKPFPALAAVTNATGLKLNFAERFEAVVKGKTALFPDGGIHWTEDGTNGLSFADTTVRIREAQVRCVREMMQGRETANKAGTAWVLNDDFMFGYMPWHDMGGNDAELYVFTTRREMNGTPPKTCVLVSFAPTQLMSDSITGAFLGDETAQANLKALKDAGVVTVVGK